MTCRAMARLAILAVALSGLAAWLGVPVATAETSVSSPVQPSGTSAPLLLAAQGQGNCACNQYIEPPYNCGVFVRPVEQQCWQLQNAGRDARQCWNQVNSERARCGQINQEWLNRCNQWLTRNCKP